MAEEMPFSPRRFRWWPGLLILLISGGLLALAATGLEDDPTQAVIWAWYIIPITAILLLGWWTFFSGLSREAKLLGWSGLLFAAATFFALFRFTDYSGAMAPLFVWRWGADAAVERQQYYQAHLAGLQRADEPEPEATPAVLAELSLAPDDWPQYRGPRRDGVVRGATITRRDWETQPPKLLWRHPVGKGWSSFAIVQGRAFTQEQHDDLEAVVCYDADTGEPLWMHTDPAAHIDAMGGDGPRCTPTVVGSRTYALGATGILNCLETLTGKVLWTKTVREPDRPDLGWGQSGSPLAVEGKVVVQPGGQAERGLVALDAITGEILWAVGSRPGGYGSPLLETVDGVPQLLIVWGDGLAGHDLETGRELWFFPWKNSFAINVALPIVQDGRDLFFGSGYGLGSVLLRPRQSSPGEWVSPPEVRWETKNRFRLKFNEAVYRDGYVYGLDDGILSCIEYATGERRWKQGRYGFGQLLLADDLLVVAAQSGEVALVRASPEEFQELTRFQAIRGKTWNVPAWHRGRLYLRNASEAACYQVSPAPPTPEPQATDP